MSGDYFSKQAAIYRTSRPDYPEELFTYLASLAPKRECAWDCATGNGQAAVALSKLFRKVLATDLSQTQLDNAIKRDNIEYSLATAEDVAIADQSIDLITIAQALHWFDHEKFYREANRVLKPGGVIAAWSYSLPQLISPELEKLLSDYYYRITGPYWPPGRHYIDEEYKTIPFPYTPIQTPTYRIERHWKSSEMLDYLQSWSATQRYIQNKGQNPLDLIATQLETHWGDDKQAVIWPIHLLVGHKNESNYSRSLKVDL